MARQTQVILTDDLDGGKADETVRFGLEDQQWEVDLSSKNADKLRAALQKYIRVGRKVGRSNITSLSSRRGRGRRTSGDLDPKAVRAWATDNGIEVSSRGRIPADVIEQFRAAGN